MSGRAWTREEQETLARAREAGLSLTTLLNLLPQRTQPAILGRLKQMGLQVARQDRYGNQMSMANVGPPPKECQWPQGNPDEDDFHFCGEPTVTGRPYCPEHMARAYTSRFEEPEDEEDDDG